MPTQTKCHFKIGDKVVMKEGFIEYRNLFNENTVYTICIFHKLNRGLSPVMEENHCFQYPENVEHYDDISKERKLRIKNWVDESKKMCVIRDEPRPKPNPKRKKSKNSYEIDEIPF